MKRSTTTWGTPVAKPNSRTVEISDFRLKQLLQLCHPDRNNGSAMSAEVFQWLQQIKKESKP
mgnify:CR=1 FL=1